MKKWKIYPLFFFYVRMSLVALVSLPAGAPD